MQSFEKSWEIFQSRLAKSIKIWGASLALYESCAKITISILSKKSIGHVGGGKWKFSFNPWTKIKAFFMRSVYCMFNGTRFVNVNLKKLEGLTQSFKGNRWKFGAKKSSDVIAASNFCGSFHFTPTHFIRFDETIFWIWAGGARYIVANLYFTFFLRFFGFIRDRQHLRVFCISDRQISG